MSTPVLHLIAGPNGAGKSTLASRVLLPITHLPFVNADEIAATRWPGTESEHARAASDAAAAERSVLIDRRSSFISETVFSHRSKLDLIREALDAGYLVTLHVVLLAEDTTVERVRYRVDHGGHTVPETKIRERYRRLWALIAEARELATETFFYDNSTAKSPFRPVAQYTHGLLVGEARWPDWTPESLTV